MVLCYDSPGKPIYSYIHKVYKSMSVITGVWQPLVIEKLVGRLTLSEAKG